METILDAASGAIAPALVLLPGAYMQARDFATHGFIPAARKTGGWGDIAAVETGMEAYLDTSIIRRLHEAIAPVRSGHRRIWLAGISLGGLGALLYAREYPDAVEGLLLLSPFIGTRGAVTGVIEAGGFDAWQAPAGDAATNEHRLLEWLKAYRPGDARWPEFYLGYGKYDRFAASCQLLAKILPAERVVTVAGGHDWDTWTVLWDRLLHTARFRDD